MLAPFEVHLTLARPEERLALWIGSRGGKYLHIELDRGRTASQPMLTFWRRDPLENVRAEAEAWSRELAAIDCPVVRLKIETHVPAKAESGDAIPSSGCYFECHLKVLLADEPDDALRRWIADRGAHLSRNARKRRDDGLHERFVTARIFGVDAETALGRFAALERTLREAGFEILEVETEHCVYDSALALDAEWLPERVEV